MDLPACYPLPVSTEAGLLVSTGDGCTSSLFASNHHRWPGCLEMLLSCWTPDGTGQHDVVQYVAEYDGFLANSFQFARQGKEYSQQSGSTFQEPIQVPMCHFETVVKLRNGSFQKVMQQTYSCKKYDVDNSVVPSRLTSGFQV